MFMTYSKQDISSLGSILGLWAHPDDETWSSAGVMAAAIENGQRVFVLTATNGDAGETADEEKWAQTSLADIRKEELAQALAAVGVVDMHAVLDYKDGFLKDVPDGEALEEISRYIDEFSPDTILTFEPNGITGHDDHKTVSRWAQRIAESSSKDMTVYGATDTEESYESVGKKAHELFNIYFATDKPVLRKETDVDICYHLPEDSRRKKRRALEAHASQTAPLFENGIGKKLLNQTTKTECFVRLN